MALCGTSVDGRLAIVIEGGLEDDEVDDDEMMMAPSN